MTTLCISFADEAEGAFAFLLADGFRLTERQSTSLVFESGRVFVAVRWDPRSGELTVFIGSQPKGQEEFLLEDLIAMENGTAQPRAPFQVVDVTKLGPFLQRLAGDLRLHAAPALAGDRMIFHRLRTFRNARAQELERDTKLSRVRFLVEEAWMAREFRKVVDLYASVEGDLSDAELAKLQYARSQLAG